MKKMMRRALIGAALTATAFCYGQQAEKKASETRPSTDQTAVAELPQEERSLQLTFTVQELDGNGKILNSRRFDTMVLANSPKGAGMSSIRAGAKVPVQTGGAGSFTYMEIGANFDVNRARIVKGNRLAMGVSSEISSFDATAGSESQPRAVHQNRWQGDVEIPIGGHKVIFSSDDLSSKKVMQIDLAVTPVVERANGTGK